MARLRYMRNARTGDAGTVCVGDLLVTGDLTVEEGYTYGSETVSLNQNLEGTLTVGREYSGHDVKFWGVGSDKYWLWDASANKVDMKGAFDITGNMNITGTLTTDAVDIVGAVAIHGDITIQDDHKIIFDDGSQFINASSGTQLEIEGPTIAMTGAVTVSGTLTTTGSIVTANATLAIDISTAATTGIDITNATTGININGTSGTANIAISGGNATGIAMTGTYTAAAISIITALPAWDDYALYIEASSVDSGTGTIRPVYVKAVFSAIGATGRAAEFLLAPTAKMGGWGNAVKAYLDLSGTSGGGGLITGLCAEVKLPNTTMTGTIAVLELELVAPGSFVANDGIQDNSVSFIYAGLEHTNNYDEIDTNGYFLNIQGLTADTNHMLYGNTLKCAIGTDRMYLLFSTAQASFTTAYPIVGTGNLTMTLTEPSAPANAIYAVADVGVAFSSGSVNAIKGLLTSDCSTGDVHNMTAGWFGLNWATGFGGVLNGVTRALNAEVVNDSGVYPSTILFLQSVPGTNADHSNMPYMVFSESGNGTGSNVLFEVGFEPALASCTSGSDLLYFQDTLRIKVNPSSSSHLKRYIPLSSVTGTFTTAYPIKSDGAGAVTAINVEGTVTLALGIGSGTALTTATSATSAVKVQSNYSKTDGYHVGAWFSSTQTATGASSGTVYALRGHAATSGIKTTIAASHYLIGTHGRVAVGGTVDAENLIAAGVCGQVLAAGTITAVSQIAAVWADSQLAQVVTAGEFSLFYGSNNGVTQCNQMIKLRGKADYGLSVGEKGSGETWYEVADTTAGDEHGWIRVNVSGTARRIKLYAEA